MANLTAEEFADAIRCLADDFGLQRLRDKLVQRHALVTRRRATSAEALASQLYALTGGLRRGVAATLAVQGLWAEKMQELLGEDGEKALEELAERINGCLGEGDRIVAEKAAELGGLLRDYEQQVAAKVGPNRARIDMLLKAVPEIAALLRSSPSAAGDSPAEGEAEQGDASPTGSDSPSDPAEA